MQADQYIFLRVTKKILYREIELSSPLGNRSIIYNGRGFGYESIIIDGVPLKKENKSLWFINEFKFTIDGLPATLRIGVGILFGIKELSLEINGLKIYSEG
jgi:hypothetical protein